MWLWTNRSITLGFSPLSLQNGDQLASFSQSCIVRINLCIQMQIMFLGARKYLPKWIDPVLHLASKEIMMLYFPWPPPWMSQTFLSSAFWGSTRPITTIAKRKKFNLLYPVLIWFFAWFLNFTSSPEFSHSSPKRGGIPGSYTLAEISSIVGLIRIQLT